LDPNLEDVEAKGFCLLKSITDALSDKISGAVIRKEVFAFYNSYYETLTKLPLRDVHGFSSLYRGLTDFLNHGIIISQNAVLKEIIKTKRTRNKGAQATNLQKSNAVTSRREIIARYLAANPKPELKGRSLAGYLIDSLGLKKSNGSELTEKTINADLKSIMEKR